MKDVVSFHVSVIVSSSCSSFSLGLSFGQLGVLASVRKDVHDIVKLSVLGIFGLLYLTSEQDGGLLLADREEHRLLHPLDRLQVQLLQVCDYHQHQQVDEDVCVAPDLEESLDSFLLELVLYLVWRPVLLTVSRL